MKAKPLTGKDVELAGSYCEDEDEEIITLAKVVSAKQWLKNQLRNYMMADIVKRQMMKKIDEAFGIDEK